MLASQTKAELFVSRGWSGTFRWLKKTPTSHVQQRFACPFTASAQILRSDFPTSDRRSNWIFRRRFGSIAFSAAEFVAVRLALTPPPRFLFSSAEISKRALSSPIVRAFSGRADLPSSPIDGFKTLLNAALRRPVRIYRTLGFYRAGNSRRVRASSTRADVFLT